MMNTVTPPPPHTEGGVGAAVQISTVTIYVQEVFKFCQQGCCNLQNTQKLKKNGLNTLEHYGMPSSGHTV